MGSDPWIASHRATLVAALGSIRQHLGTLHLATNVAAAEWWLGETKMGPVPIEPLRLAAGTLRVEVRASGYRPLVRTVLLPSGGSISEAFDLTPLPPEPAVVARPPFVAPPPDVPIPLTEGS